jgi:hypothetical protein
MKKAEFPSNKMAKLTKNNVILTKIANINLKINGKTLRQYDSYLNQPSKTTNKTLKNELLILF